MEVKEMVGLNTIGTTNDIEISEQQEPKITVEHIKNADVVTFTNKRILEEWDIQTLQELIMAVIEKTQRIKLILDFRYVQFISSSAGLGTLIRIREKVYAHAGQLRLCNINPKVYEIFEITWLTKIFNIQSDLKGALESLSVTD